MKKTTLQKAQYLFIALFITYFFIYHPFIK